MTCGTIAHPDYVSSLRLQCEVSVERSGAEHPRGGEIQGGSNEVHNIFREVAILFLHGLEDGDQHRFLMPIAFEDAADLAKFLSPGNNEFR